IALPADEMVLIDPLPGARLEVPAHPIAVHQVHDQGAAGGERPLDRFEDCEIVLRTLEIAKRIAQNADAVKFAVAEVEAPRIAFVEGNLQIALLGTFAGEPDQIARAVEPDDIGKPARSQFERMSALAAAQIEDAVVALEPSAADQQVDLVGGDAVVLD